MDGKNADLKVTQQTSRLVIEGDFAVPAAFVIEATWKDGDRMIVNAKVADGKARAASVTIETPNLAGVTNALLQHLPVRLVMAHGVLLALLPVEATTEGIKFLPGIAPGEPWRKATDLVKRLVRWVDEKDVAP